MPTVAAESELIVDYLRNQGVRLVAASPIADHSWDQVDLIQPVALVLGTVILVTLTTAIVSYMPARKIAKMNPNDAIRGKIQ